jgi:hypothetical protein
MTAVFYGLGSRGVAVHAPDTDGQIHRDIDPFEPLPLWRRREDVQAIIDARNAARGRGNLHVIAYEVRS